MATNATDTGKPAAADVALLCYFKGIPVLKNCRETLFINVQHKYLSSSVSCVLNWMVTTEMKTAQLTKSKYVSLHLDLLCIVVLTGTGHLQSQNKRIILIHINEKKLRFFLQTVEYLLLSC